MKNYNHVIKKKKIPQLFILGMYRSGTTAIARFLAGEHKIAFCSDPIRPFFNWYRTKLQKDINCSDVEDHTRPLGDYFQGNINYINKLKLSKFSEKVKEEEIKNIRKSIIEHGLEYSPKFINNLAQSSNFSSITYADELKFYLSLIMYTYGNDDTSLVGLKEVWSIEMALPIIKMIGDDAKILVVIRDPLDIMASSLSGSNNYCILTLARQWRKQIVFYNYLKFLYPNQVTSINYEDFCRDPNVLKIKIGSLIDNSEEVFSEKYNLSDDYGKSWIKNSSYSNQKLTSLIDDKSIGKYLKILSNPEIQWASYLTYMSSYTKYNRSKAIPALPNTVYPKKKFNKISDWAKFNILNLEGTNLDKELKLEHNRILKISDYKFQFKIKENIINQT